MSSPFVGVGALNDEPAPGDIATGEIGPSPRPRLGVDEPNWEDPMISFERRGEEPEELRGGE